MAEIPFEELTDEQAIDRLNYAHGVLHGLMYNATTHASDDVRRMIASAFHHAIVRLSESRPGEEKSDG